MKEKEAYPQNAELSTEQNYTMINGIPNNTILPTPPSVPISEIKLLNRVEEPALHKESWEFEQ